MYASVLPFCTGCLTVMLYSCSVQTGSVSFPVSARARSSRLGVIACDRPTAQPTGQELYCEYIYIIIIYKTLFPFVFVLVYL